MQQNAIENFPCYPDANLQGAWMSRLMLLIIVALVSCAPKDPADPKFVVAKAAGQKILRADLDESLNVFLKSQGGSRDQLPAPMIQQLERQLLNQLIDGTVVVSHVKKSAAAELAQKVDAEFAQFTERLGGPEKVTEMLESLGATEAALRRQIEQSVAVSMLMELEPVEKRVVSDEETRKFYDDNPQYWQQEEMAQARHVLVAVPKGSDAATLKAGKDKADAARKRVAGGESFATVAEEISDDPGSKSQGGMLPPFGKGRMVPEFEKVAFSSKEGTLSPVFQTDFGYHFMEVLKRSEAGTMSYEEVKGRIKSNLESQDQGRQFQEKIASLRDAAKVEVFLPEPSPVETPATLPPGNPPIE